MRRKLVLLTTLIACVLTVETAPKAEGLRAVRPLNGYKCMGLTAEEMASSSPGPAILTEPKRGAAVLGRASATVIVANPERTSNGFTAVLTLSGKPGWVDTKVLAPYASLTNPSARCVPSLMSNGGVGFAYPRA